MQLGSLNHQLTLFQDAKGQEDARKRIASQMPLAEKEALADYVIHNDGPLEELPDKVAKIVDTWRQNLGISRLFNAPIMMLATAGFIGMVVMPVLHRVRESWQ